MKEYSRQSIDRLGFASLALALLIGLLSATNIATHVMDRSCIFAIAATFFVLGSALILRARFPSRTLRIAAIISGVISIGSVLAIMAHTPIHDLGYISLVSMFVTCSLIVASADFGLEATGRSRGGFRDIWVSIVWLAVLVVLYFFGDIKGEFFSRYFWMVIAISAFGILARWAILRDGRSNS